MNKNKAFTLFEIVIVVVIVFIISAMVIPIVARVSGNRAQAQYVVTHRHQTGGYDTYYTVSAPYVTEGAWRVNTVDGKQVWVSGDVTVEQIRK